jgi:hypothetical protein
MNQNKKFILDISKFKESRCVVPVILFCSTAFGFMACSDGTSFVLNWLIG